MLILLRVTEARRNVAHWQMGLSGAERRWGWETRG
jgi:hypothetical protein